MNLEEKKHEQNAAVSRFVLVIVTLFCLFGCVTHTGVFPILATEGIGNGDISQFEVLETTVPLPARSRVTTIFPFKRPFTFDAVYETEIMHIFHNHPDVVALFDVQYTSRALIIPFIYKSIYVEVKSSTVMRDSSFGPDNKYKKYMGDRNFAYPVYLD